MQPLTDAQKRRLPWVLAMAIFMQMLDTNILNTALPNIARDLNQSPLDMQMVVISYALTLALVMPLCTHLSNTMGTRKLFVSAIALFTIGSLCCAIAPTLNALIIGRIVQGLGGAMMVPVARLALIKSFDKSQWLEALNFAIMPAMIGPIIGPLLGGYIATLASWHWIFLINLPIGAIGIYFGMKNMPNITEAHSKMDLPGYLLFSCAAFLLTLGLDWLGYGSKSGDFMGAIILGFMFLLAYAFYAKEHRNAVFPAHLFFVRTFRIGIIGNLVSRIGISAIPLLLPLLLQVAFHYSSEISGWMLVPIAVSSLAAKPLISIVLHRFGYRNVLTVNTVIVGLCTAALALPDENTPLWYFLPLLIIVGLTHSIQFSSMNTITIADLRSWQTASGNSLMAVNQQLSMGFGLAIGASLLHLTPNLSWVGDDVHTAFRTSFVILGVLTIASSAIFYRLHQDDGDMLANRIQNNR